MEPLTLLFLIATTGAAQTPPGRLIDVGGYHVHLHCTGVGTPTCLGRVDEIHRLLKSARIDGPYVLAGFSTGALFARLSANDHAFIRAPSVAPAVTSGPHRWAMSRNPAGPTVEIAELLAGKSFHSIEISQPEVVIHAIRLAVQAAQQ